MKAPTMLELSSAITEMDRLSTPVCRIRRFEMSASMQQALRDELAECGVSREGTSYVGIPVVVREALGHNEYAIVIQGKQQ